MGSGFDGSALQHVRERRRFSRAEFATQLSVDVETVRQWEVGITNPTPTVVPRIAAVLGIRTEDLYLRPRRGVASLADLRAMAGLTQAALAEKLQVSKATVSNWERGKSAFPLASVPVAATAFNSSEAVVLAAIRGEDGRTTRALPGDGPGPPESGEGEIADKINREWRSHFQIDDPRLDQALLRLTFPEVDKAVLRQQIVDYCYDRYIDVTVGEYIKQFSESISVIEQEGTPLPIRLNLLQNMRPIQLAMYRKYRSIFFLDRKTARELDILDRRWEHAMQESSNAQLEDNRSIEQRRQDLADFIYGDTHRKIIESDGGDPSELIVHPARSIHLILSFQGEMKESTVSATTPQLPGFRYDFSPGNNLWNAIITDFCVKFDMYHRYNHNEKQIIVGDGTAHNQTYRIRWQNYMHDHIRRFSEVPLIEEQAAPEMHQKLISRGEPTPERLVIVVDANDRIGWIINQLHSDEMAILWPNFFRDGTRPVMDFWRGRRPRDGILWPLNELGITGESTFADFVEIYYKRQVETVETAISDVYDISAATAPAPAVDSTSTDIDRYLTNAMSIDADGPLD